MKLAVSQSHSHKINCLSLLFFCWSEVQLIPFYGCIAECDASSKTTTTRLKYIMSLVQRVCCICHTMPFHSITRHLCVYDMFIISGGGVCVNAERGFACCVNEPFHLSYRSHLIRLKTFLAHFHINLSHNLIIDF